MRRKILALLAAGAMLLTFAPVVQAGTQGSCNSTDTSKVRLWENGSNDSSDGDDSLWICATHTNFSAITHTLPGGCKTSFPLGDSWNDCISSWTVWVPPNSAACLYKDSFLNNLLWYKTGGSSGVAAYFQNVSSDQASSITWGWPCP